MFTEVTTVESILVRAVTALNQDQELRKVENPDTADKIQGVIMKLEELKTLTQPFVMVIHFLIYVLLNII